MKVPTKSSKSIRPKQSLGQNFLRDDNIVRKIIAAVNPQPADVLLEIGPGEGALTTFLAPHVDRLIVVDVDHRVIDRMTRLYPHDEVEIVHGDFLGVDFAETLRRRNAELLRIVGNIPYNITSPILFHILDNRQHVSDATLTMQKEVARRLVAKPCTKDYGILAVFCQLFADAELLFDVSPNCFFPAPKVISSVVQLKMLKQPRFALSDENHFRAMVRAIFGKRRKTLRNSLSYFVDPLPALPDRFDLSKRPEALSIEELVELGNALLVHVSSTS